jgi:hypothetical protein
LFSLDLVHIIEQRIARRLYAESWLIVWSSCWLALLFVGILVIFAFGWPWLVVIALPVFLISHLIAIVVAFRFRCPACHRRLLVQGFGPWHPARRILFPGIASWIAVAFDIARHREFTWLHCRERSSVRSNKSLEPTAGRRDVQI